MTGKRVGPGGGEAEYFCMTVSAAEAPRWWDLMDLPDLDGVRPKC